tara:strand:+ start:1426 stop:1902 length:477 start_codon:yes stop_codon:yes gene_type:complete
MKEIMKKIFLCIISLLFFSTAFANSLESRKSKISKLSDEDICSVLGPWTKIDMYLSEAKSRNLDCLYDDAIFDLLPSPYFENSYPRVNGISDAIKIIEAHNNAYLHVQKGTHKTPPGCWSFGENTNVFAWKYNCFLINDRLIRLKPKYQISRPEKLLA